MNLPVNLLPGPPFTGDTTTTWSDFGNAFNCRQVYGETTSIPLAGYVTTGTGTVYGAPYALACGPIEVWQDSNGLEGLNIKSGDLRRISTDSDTVPRLRAGQYAINYGDTTTNTFPVAFPSNTTGHDINYLISYSWWPADGSLQSTIDQRDSCGQWLQWRLVTRKRGQWEH